MNTMNLSPLSFTSAMILMAGLLWLSVGTVRADQPTPESFGQRDELVLTLSDAWLANDDPHQASSSVRKRQKDDNQSKTGADLTKPVDLGCGMDVSQFGGDSNSIGSRLVGECNLNYRY